MMDKDLINKKRLSFKDKELLIGLIISAIWAILLLWSKQNNEGDGEKFEKIFRDALPKKWINGEELDKQSVVQLDQELFGNVVFSILKISERWGIDINKVVDFFLKVSLCGIVPTDEAEDEVKCLKKDRDLLNKTLNGLGFSIRHDEFFISQPYNVEDLTVVEIEISKAN